MIQGGAKRGEAKSDRGDLGRPGSWGLSRLRSCTMELVAVVDGPRSQSGYAEIFIPADGHRVALGREVESLERGVDLGEANGSVHLLALGDSRTYRNLDLR